MGLRVSGREITIPSATLVLISFSGVNPKSSTIDNIHNLFIVL
jgi:hypothetical protein